MLLRASLLALVMGASGCLHNARLTSAKEAVETFNAPVKCGPMGFRKVPLASRFGEYVRLTVSAPVALSGSVMVHANGVAHPARVWTSAGDGLVVEARFENTDPDLPSALRATQPIDVTISELTAPEGGTCEGAVFTLEHGRLLAPASDALWVAELERRGGTELAARREARRRMSEEELARETENSQPEFSTVLAGWTEAETEQTNTAVAQLNLEGITAQTSIAQAAEYAVNVDARTAAIQEAHHLDGVTAQTSVAQAAEYAESGHPADQNTAVAQVNINGAAPNTALAQMNLDGVTAQTSIAQAAEYAESGYPVAQNTAVAQVNINGVPSQTDSIATSTGAQNTAVAQVNINGVPSQTDSIAMSTGAQNTAVAQVNINGVPSQNGSVATSSGAQNTAVAQVNINGVPSQAGSISTSLQNTAEAEVNVGASQAAPDFTHRNDPFAYDDSASQRGHIQLDAPPLPSVGAMFPAGCSELSCVVPATQCTQGCTPAPGSCTASTCTVNGQHIEFAVYPRGCARQTCAMPISQCTGACSRAPGAFINGTYACPAQMPAAAPQTESWASYQPTPGADAEWSAPPSVTTQVAYELPRPQPQMVVAAPQPETEVEVDVLPMLPWLIGAALSLPHPAPVLVSPPRYAPTPRYVPVHGARPVGARSRR